MSTFEGLTRRAWRDRFVEIDDCPWPGPRPLTTDDEALLVGRYQDLENLADVLLQSRLVLLHGPSGVGKTSLLQAGFVPAMRQRKRQVLHADQWGGSRSSDIGSFVAGKLQMPNPGPDSLLEFGRRHKEQGLIILDQFEELVRYSPAMAGKVFDLVLDLNRRVDLRIIVSFRSEYLHEFVDLEKRAVNFSVKTVRLPDLKPENADLVILSGNHGDRACITADAALALADAWNAACTEARNEVSAEGAATDDPFTRVGLLHLQAMLYSLHFANGGRPLTKELIEELTATARRDAGIDPPKVRGPADPDAATPDEGDDLDDLDDDGYDDEDLDDEERPTFAHPVDAADFRLAVGQAVDIKLDHCEAACRPPGLASTIDDGLVEGTRWMVGRTVSHLSSAGYKLVRGAQELSVMAMGVDHEALLDGLRTPSLPTDRQLQHLFDSVIDMARIGDVVEEAEDEAVDVLVASRERIAARADDALDADLADPHVLRPGTRWVERLAAPGLLDSDPDYVTCGSMMGLAPADVLVEELRRFSFALAWLETSALVRVTTPIGTGRVVSLIHDGFGSALKRWAKERSTRAEGPLNAITAPRGASFTWSDGPVRLDPSRPPAVSGAADPLGYRVLPNLRWRGGWVQADFEQVVFANCDFRGTLFDGCHLTGVKFVNCLLDGTIFSRCIVSGTHHPMPADAPWSDDQPDFTIEAPAVLVAAHARARGLDPPAPVDERATALMLCGLAGSFSRPYCGEEPRTQLRAPGRLEVQAIGRLLVDPLDGGVAVYGGRLSSLVIRGCSLDGGSGFAFRHTTGSGLEIVEIQASPGEFEIYGSAMRHVVLSAPPGQTGAVQVRISARESVLVQLWVGPHLTGSVQVQGSRLVHAGNSSPIDPTDPDSVGVRITTHDSRVHGVLGGQADPDDVAGVGATSVAEIGLAGFDEQLGKMDYRENPARLESS